MDTNIKQREFSELLRTYRARRGATQRQLADLSTVSIRAIRDLERGRAHRPRRDTVRLIADGLGLGGRERAAFEAAAGCRATSGDLKVIYAAEPTAPPAPLDTLVGREAEGAVLRELLRSGDHRLVTITGIGGVGKTRIAQEVAGTLHESAGFPVLWSSSDDLASPHWNANRSDHLSGLIHAGLDGLFTSSDRIGELGALIGDGPTVLVLDGYEPATVRMDRVMALLQQCRRLRVLTTAQQPLEVRGERVFPLAPLAVPDRRHGDNLATIARVASVRLLIRFAHQVQPDFELTAANAPAVATLCEWLDGIPIVLEAAASWFLVYDPWTLLDHVRSDPFGFVAEELPNQRNSLYRTVSGLDATERALLAQVAGIDDSWSMSEAASLAGVPLTACARMVRRLLTLGLVRSGDDEPGRARFQTLRLIQSLYLNGESERHCHAEVV